MKSGIHFRAPIIVVVTRGKEYCEKPAMPEKLASTEGTTRLGGATVNPKLVYNGSHKRNVTYRTAELTPPRATSAPPAPAASAAHIQTRRRRSPQTTNSHTRSGAKAPKARSAPPQSPAPTLPSHVDS